MENLFSNRRYWMILALYYIIFQGFPSQAKKTRKSRFQINNVGIIFQRFPSQAQKNNGTSVLEKKMLALFSKGSHHKHKKTTEIPFSNRRYCLTTNGEEETTVK